MLLTAQSYFILKTYLFFSPQWKQVMKFAAQRNNVNIL